MLVAQSSLFGDDTLATARAHVMAELDAGSICPCCDQYARRYRRKLNSGMAAILIWLAKQHEKFGGWIDVHKTAPRFALRSNEVSRLELWALVAAKPGDDPHRRDSGLWAPTARGLQFVRAEIRVPAYAIVYNGIAQGFSSELTTIHQALGEKFSYSELMQLESGTEVRGGRP